MSTPRSTMDRVSPTSQPRSARNAATAVMTSFSVSVRAIRASDERRQECPQFSDGLDKRCVVLLVEARASKGIDPSGLGHDDAAVRDGDRERADIGEVRARPLLLRVVVP